MLGRLLLVACLVCGQPAAAGDDENYERQRRQLLEEVRGDFMMTGAQTGLPKLSETVAAALGAVPRHRFVPPERRSQAYLNHPLPIGYGQTISQPYIVALMTQILNLESNHTVLEVGTGSAYQAAVLAEVVARVYTIEIIEELGSQAARRLPELGYDNVAVKLGDGYYGWAEHAPFDAIIVTAAASHVPPPLVSQLRPGGRMVIPVGSRFLTQYLLLIEKTSTGVVTTREILPVRFVPLTGGH